MKRRATRVFGIATAAAAFAASLAAQELLQPAGFSLTLPNYGMTPIGQVAGMEGGAFVARANDASSNWYNPAGLALAEKSSISSSAGTYQSFSLVPEELDERTTREGPRKRSRRSSASSSRISSAATTGPPGSPPSGRTPSSRKRTPRSTTSSAIPARFVDYSADSSYRRTEYSLGVGYTCASAWRFGATLAVANTSLRAVGSILNQRLDPDGLFAELATRRASGSITQLRLAAGAQYQLTPEILLGAIARSPGLDLFRSARIRLRRPGTRRRRGPRVSRSSIRTRGSTTSFPSRPRSEPPSRRTGSSSRWTSTSRAAARPTISSRAIAWRP